MLRPAIRLLTAAALAALSASTTAAIPDDPASARLVTEDIDRFWAAWDADRGPPSAATLERLYLGPASPGLQDFLRLRIESADKLARTVGRAQTYYHGIRPATLQVSAQLPAVRAALEALERLYPPAVFPDVYFVVGRLTSGGTLSERALLIGVEMYGRSERTPMHELTDWHRAVIGRSVDLPHIVAHELVHYQQRGPGRQRTLLEQAVHEGVADLIAERISGRHINALAHAWGRANECAVWREFEPRMHGTDYDGFLYGGENSTDRPADLGYFIGYRIAEAYVAKAAVDPWADVLGAKSAADLLAEGGYAPCGAG